MSVQALKKRKISNRTRTGEGSARNVDKLEGFGVVFGQTCDFVATKSLKSETIWDAPGAKSDLFLQVLSGAPVWLHSDT